MAKTVKATATVSSVAYRMIRNDDDTSAVIWYVEMKETDRSGANRWTDFGDPVDGASTGGSNVQNNVLQALLEDINRNL